MDDAVGDTHVLCRTSGGDDALGAGRDGVSRIAELVNGALQLQRNDRVGAGGLVVQAGAGLAVTWRSDGWLEFPSEDTEPVEHAASTTMMQLRLLH